MKYIKISSLYIISGLLLYYVFKDVDSENLYKVLTRVPLSYPLVAIGLVSAAVYARMRRWKSLLVELKRDVRSISILSSGCIGFLCDQVLPAKAGEVIRSYLLAKKEGVSAITVFGTAIIERILDISVILFLSSLVLLFVDMNDSKIIVAQTVGIAILTIALLLILLVTKYSELVIRWVGRWAPEKIRRGLEQGITSLVHGLTTIRSMKQLVKPVCWTLVIWMLIAASIYPVLQSFDIGAQIPASAVFTILLFISLGLSFPGAPAGIGIFEYACYLSLIIYLSNTELGLPTTAAEIGIFATILHLTLSIPELILGGIFLSREELTLSGLSKLGVTWRARVK